jgi:hypothetical protein
MLRELSRSSSLSVALQNIWKKFSILFRLSARFFLLPYLIVGFSSVDAQDFGSSFSVSQGIAAQSMIQSVGDTTNQIVNLIMGPGMFVVMALGAVLALFGWARGNKESLWTGLVLFVLAAILRGIWAFL